MMLDAGSGGGRDKYYTKFTLEELMSHLALYLLHGIFPSPNPELKFKRPMKILWTDPTYAMKLLERIQIQDR